MKIPVFLPVTREFGLRDEFAQDCLLQRGVYCEPAFREPIHRFQKRHAEFILGLPLAGRAVKSRGW